MEKLEWCGYPKVKKFRRYVYSFWYDPRTWQTGGRTDRHRMTAIAELMHSIARQKNSSSLFIRKICTAANRYNVSGGHQARGFRGLDPLSHSQFRCFEALQGSLTTALPTLPILTFLFYSFDCLFRLPMDCLHDNGTAPDLPCSSVYF